MVMTFILALIIFAIIGALIASRKLDHEDDQTIAKVAGGVLTLIFFIVLGFSTFTTVDSGTVGVTKTFGKYGGTLTEGVNIVAPWTEVVEVNIKNQDYTMSAKSNEGQEQGDDSIKVTSSDQLAIPTDITVLYRVEPSRASDLLREVGDGYETKIVRPNAREIIRDIGAQFDAVSLVTTSRTTFSAKIDTELTRILEPFGIVVTSVNVRDMSLPAALQESITAKATASQLAEQKIAELRREQLQADITRTQAQATADSQQIVACGGKTQDVVGEDGKTKQVVVPNRGAECDQTQLTPAFLQSEYIKALKELVDSPNNSTLILPTDQALTPLINTGK